MSVFPVTVVLYLYIHSQKLDSESDWHSNTQQPINDIWGEVKSLVWPSVACLAWFFDAFWFIQLIIALWASQNTYKTARPKNYQWVLISQRLDRRWHTISWTHLFIIWSSNTWSLLMFKHIRYKLCSPKQGVN